MSWWSWIIEELLPATETLRRIEHRLKELKSLKRRVARLEKRFGEYQETLRQRRELALEREASFVARIGLLENEVRRLRALTQ